MQIKAPCLLGKCGLDSLEKDVSAEKSKRWAHYRTRHSPIQSRPVKLQTSNRSRQSLEVITEEIAQQYTRRRKQLIPRARLKRVEESRRIQSCRSPGLHPQRIHSHQELTLLLTPPPDFRTDDYISEGTLRRLTRAEDRQQKPPPIDRRQKPQFEDDEYVQADKVELIKQQQKKQQQQESKQKSTIKEEYIEKPRSPEADYLEESIQIEDESPEPDHFDEDQFEDVYIHKPPSFDKQILQTVELQPPNYIETDYCKRRFGPPSDLIGIPLEEHQRTRQRNIDDIHTIKIEGVNSRSNNFPLPKGRVNSKTIVRNKDCSLSKLNITNVIITECSERDIAEGLYNSVHRPGITPPHISTYVINDPSANWLPESTFKRHRTPILEETADEIAQENGYSTEEDSEESVKQEPLKDDHQEPNPRVRLPIKEAWPEKENDSEKEKDKPNETKESPACSTAFPIQNNTQNKNSYSRYIKKSSSSNASPTGLLKKSSSCDQLDTIYTDRSCGIRNNNLYSTENKIQSRYLKNNAARRNSLYLEDKIYRTKENLNEKTNDRGFSGRNIKSNKIPIYRTKSAESLDNRGSSECFQGLRAKILKNYLDLDQEGERASSSNCEVLSSSKLDTGNKNRKQNGLSIAKEDTLYDAIIKENKANSEERILLTIEGPVKQKAAIFQELSTEKHKTATNSSEEKLKNGHKPLSNTDKIKPEKHAYGKPRVLAVKEKESPTEENISCQSSGENKTQLVEASETHKVKEIPKSETEKGNNNSTVRNLYDYVRGKARRVENLSEVKHENSTTKLKLPRINSVRRKGETTDIVCVYSPPHSINSDKKDSDSHNSKESLLGTEGLYSSSAVGKQENKTILQYPIYNPKTPKEENKSTATKEKHPDKDSLATVSKESLKSTLCKRVSIVKKESGTTENKLKSVANGDYDEPDTKDTQATQGKPQDEEMSRRPQVLKVKDSATTSSSPRCRSGERRDLPGYGLIRPKTEENHYVAEGPSEEKNITQKMRCIFEGSSEVTTQEKEPEEPKEPCTNVGIKCEQISSSKPMLIATLSVEDVGTLEKKPKNKDIVTPRQILDTSTLPKAKTPAFRAFSCNGQETLTDIGKNVPEYFGVSNRTSKKGAFCDQERSKERDSKVAAFDGLLQYLQEYRHGLRELLINNNVVIIEPIRQSKVKLEDQKYSTRKSTSESSCRITGATIKKSSEALNVSPGSNTLPRQQKLQQPVLRRHFFYHPNRRNRELVDEELPDPDKVRHAREMFERTLKMRTPTGETFSNTIDTKCNHKIAPTKLISVPKVEKKNTGKLNRKYLTVDTVFRHNVLQRRWTDTGSLSSGVSSDLSYYDTDLESPGSRGEIFSRNSSHKDESADIFSSDDNEYTDEMDSKHNYLDDGDERHYVSAEVMEKIRACGTTVTYYGGQVISASNGPTRSPMTLAIMNEIKNTKNTPKKGNGGKIFQEDYLGVKFRLVKSNSCSSRLELAGTEEDDRCDENWEKVDDKTDDEHEEIINEEHTKICGEVEQIEESNSKIECKLKKINDSKQNEETLEHNKPTIENSSTEIRTPTVESLSSIFQRANETNFVFSKTGTSNNTLRGGPPKMFFSPEKIELIERSKSFDEIEFEEYEIAEDSLNITEDNRQSQNHSSDTHEKNEHTTHNSQVEDECSITVAEIAERQQNEAIQNSLTKPNDIQMTTWASRSVLFDFRNTDNERSHLPAQKQIPNHSTC